MPMARASPSDPAGTANRRRCRAGSCRYTASRPARRAASIPSSATDRLLVPSGEVEHGRQVGVDPEQLVEVAELLGHRARLAQHRDRVLGVGAPAQRDAERRRRVQLRRACRRRATPRHPDARRGPASRPRRRCRRASASGPARHARSRALARRGARHELHGTTPRGQRALEVAGAAKELAEPIVDEAEPSPVPARIRAGDRGLEVGRGPERAARPNAASAARTPRSATVVDVSTPPGVPAAPARPDRPARRTRLASVVPRTAIASSSAASSSAGASTAAAASAAAGRHPGRDRVVGEQVVVHRRERIVARRRAMAAW